MKNNKYSFFLIAPVLLVAFFVLPHLVFSDGILDNIPNQTVTEFGTLSFVATTTAVDQSLQFSLDQNAPVNATIDPYSGVFSFTPTEEQGPGTYPVTVTVSGYNGGDFPTELGTSTFNIEVSELNQDPNAYGNEISADENTPEIVTLSGQDSDLPVQTLTFGITLNPEFGTLSNLNPTTGEVTYTPNLNYFGNDSFEFEVNDGISSSSPSQIYIYVRHINQPPVITLNGSNPINLFVGDTFIDPGAEAVDPEDSVEFGTTTVSVSGEVNTSVAGKYTLIYTAWDRNELSTSTERSVNILVKEQTPPPPPPPQGGNGPIVGSGVMAFGYTAPVVPPTQPAQEPLLPEIPVVEPKKEEPKSVVISWGTNIPATSQVIYGLTNNGQFTLNLKKENFGFPFATLENKTKKISHSVSIPDVIVGQSYSLRVVSFGEKPTFGPEYRFILNADGTVSTEGAFGGDIIIDEYIKPGDNLDDFIKINEVKLKNIENSSTTNPNLTANVVSGIKGVSWINFIWSPISSNFLTKIFNILGKK